MLSAIPVSVGGNGLQTNYRYTAAGFAGGAAGTWAANTNWPVNGVFHPLVKSAIVSPLAAGAGHIAGGTTGNLFAGQSLDKAFTNSFKGIGQSMAMGGAIGIGTTIGISYVSGYNPLTGNVLAAKEFSSFNAFKKDYGSAGKGNAWHHIVEQGENNVSRFGTETIHNANNIIKLPHGAGSIHAKVSGYYSSKQAFTGGQTVRQWLSTQSYQQQYDFGIKTLKQFGWTP
jgi:hypothetical protein